MSPTYRNARESTGKHIPTEAIVGREGFVAVEIRLVSFDRARREAGEAKMAPESHANERGQPRNRQHRIMAPKSWAAVPRK